MPINPEIVEWSAIVAPAILASVLLVLHASKIQMWCVKVIGSSAVSLLSIGLTLMRLTSQCSSDSLKCDSSQTVTPRIPGIIRVCQLCVDPSSSSFWSRVNEVELQAQAILAALCLGASLVVTVHFILWCRKHVFSS